MNEGILHWKLFVNNEGQDSMILPTWSVEVAAS